MRNKVSGKIARADNGQGIENLTVAIFDIDSASSIAAMVFGDGKAIPTVSDQADFTTPAIESLKLLFGPSLEEDSELRGDAPSGDRIGSVLTDVNGYFELEFGDDAYNDDGKEKRPDILLTVFGPDTSIAIDGSGFGLPEFKRVVHLALYPRWNAGRQESFFIRVPKELFEKAGLPIIKEGKPLSNAESLKRELENQKKERLEIEKVRQDFSANDIKKNLALKDKSELVANKVLNNLSGPSNQAYFLSGAMPARERALKRESAITEAQTVGINNLAKIGLPGPDGAVLARPLPLYIPDSVLFPFFPDWNNLPNPSFQVTVDTTCGLINAAAGGKQLIRSKTLKGLIDRNKPIAVEQPTDSDPTTTDEEPSVEEDLSELTTQERIQRLIEKQISDVVISQPTDPALPRSTLARLNVDLNNAVIAPGPADTASFHDSHTLQIAFENVWTQSLSFVHKEWIKYLYTQMNTVNERFGNTIDPVLIDEINSLDELIESGMKVADIEDSDEAPFAIPSGVLVFLSPEIRGLWGQLNTYSRAYLEGIASKKMEIPAEEIANYFESDLQFFYMIHDRSPHPLTEILESAILIRGFSDKIEQRKQEVKNYLSGLNLVAAKNMRLRRLLDQLATTLGENYKFEHFEKNSVNYGVITTVRNTMNPGSYQCGNLVKSIPLAPGQSISFETTQTYKTNRARKEVEKNESSRSFDSTTTNRLDTEILRRAEETTNFSTSTQGTFNLAIGSITNTTSFQADQKRHSQDLMKSHKENILKKAGEVKSEAVLEVSLTNDSEYSAKESGELKNPNNELTVTYLLYELERQYKISQKIHAVTPVVMIAQEMPAPDDITEAWLLRYDWILKRALLDQQFMLPIEILRTALVSNEVSINLKKANWQTQLSIVENLQGETSTLLEEKRKLHDQLITAEYNSENAEALEDSGGFLHRIAKAITPFDPLALATDNSEAIVNQAKSLLEVAENEFANAAEKLANSREALNSSAKDYSAAVESTTQRRTLIDQLRIHVKDNILHYMQAIWAYEPNDQRYFRLYKKPAFFPQQSRTELTVRRATPDDTNGVQIPGVPGPNVVIEGLGVPEWSPSVSDNNRPLHEIADLDNPLGFKANYILFPLKECNIITDFMISKFVDSNFSSHDQEELSEYTNEDLAGYGDVLKQKSDELRGAGYTSEADAKIAEANIVTSIIGKRLDNSNRKEDTISLPTGQLYMEALVGKNTLLEPFKLAHRGYDALSAREDLIKKGLDNLGYAARMTSSTPNFDEPADKSIKITGGNETIVNTG